MLANYSELQQEIADTLHRGDLTSKIPSFIKLFESRANRELRSLRQERIDVLTLLSGTDNIALPAGFLEVLSLTVMIGGHPYLLEQESSKSFAEGAIITQSPGAFRIYGTSIVFDNVADQDYTINFQYIKRWDLAADNVNDLLLINPDVYLYGSLSSAAVYIGDDDRLPLWAQLADSAVDAVNRLDSRNRRKMLLQADYGSQDFGEFEISSFSYY